MEYYQLFRYGNKDGQQVEERVYYTAGGRKTDLMDHEGDASHAEHELPPEYFAIFMVPANMGALPVKVGTQMGVTPHIVLVEHFVKIDGAKNPHDALVQYKTVAANIEKKMEESRKQSQIAIANEMPAIIKP